jgi:three-Cys-motif partner protein
MPLVNKTVGVGKGTPKKQQDFGKLFAMHLAITRVVIENGITKARSLGWQPPSEVYWYVDLTAGPGEYNGLTGSPLIAADMLMIDDRPWRAWYCEKDATNAATLKQLVWERGRDVEERSRILIGDHRQSVKQILFDMTAGGKQRHFGLVYADPNGTKLDAELETIRELTAAHPKLDVLVHLSATRIKWFKKVHGHASLVEKLESIGKKHLLVREPWTDQQWTFALLTDWDGYPDWKSLGLHSTKTTQGKAVLETLDISEKERGSKGGQQTLW